MASHEFLDHVGETRLHIKADRLEHLLVEAAVALGRLEQGGIAPVPGQVTRQISLAAVDPGALLVDWLNELIYLAETEACVPIAADLNLTGPTALEATVTCQRLARPPALVKAATHHGLRIDHTPRGWDAEVLFDV